ncbi:MAG: hypothetical protein QMD36_05710 [Candidatus Aenigmarchaeota archaeon]|nr:hypothetical protein [Candidatus Aenigmarchaeota archaeon]
MRKFFCLLVLLLLFPVVRARNAVFVSKYESSSMDINTLNYYDVINDIFSNVNIIQDVEVKKNSTKWIDAYANTDMIFVISLSDEMFRVSRDIFCGNLSVVLNKTKGIVFAGDSNIFKNNDMFGCPYTSYFNLASGANNVELKNNSVKLNMSHQITSGFTINKTYNVKINDSFYPLIYPNGCTILGTVYGDPDGPGSLLAGDYPFLMIWEGIANRIAVWTMNTSELTDCTDCLGWNLFNQLLDWVSNTSDIGFKIITDKEAYYPDERIQINVKAPVDIGGITGTIYYPNNENHSLSFTGSGKERSAVYLLGKDVPSGNYNIEVVVDGLKKSKMISVSPFYLNLTINNQTEKVKVWVNVTDPSGNIVNVNLTVNITSPKGEKSNYYFENNGSVFFTYDALESGEYTVYAKAIDGYGRSDSKTKSFSFYFKANIKFIPQNITRVVQEAGNITVNVKIFNNATNNVSNTRIEKIGEIKDWIILENTSLGDIEPNESKDLTFKINVPDVEEGEYNGSLKFLFDGEEYILPITIKMEYLGILSVNPESWEGWIIKGQSKTIQFSLSNSGRREVIIKSVEVMGDLEDRISIIQKPDKIEVGMNKSLKIEIKTSDISMEGLTKRFNNELKITTGQGIHYPLASLRINVVENIREMANDLSVELEELKSNITVLKKVIDVSSLESKSNEIKTNLDRVKDSFDQGNYENAVTLYESLELEIESLKTDIERAYIEAKEMKKPNTLIIVALIVSIAVVGIILFIYRKIQSEKKYAWLYQKWKARTRYHLFK